MAGIVTTIGIVAFLTVSAIVALIARTMKSWGAGLRELQRDMLQMKSQIDEIKKQLADVMIRLS